MSDQDRTTAAFSNTLADRDSEELQPISRLALVACLFGVLSGLAFFHGVLWVLPAAGCVIGGIALRQTTRPDSVYTGGRIATIGLGLSILFGALVVAKAALEYRLVTQQAVQFAESWIDITRSGNIPQAANWFQAPGIRPAVGTDLAEHYESNEDAKLFLQSVKSNPAVQRLKRLGPVDQDENKVISFAKIEKYTHDGGTYALDLRFDMPRTNGKASPPLRCKVLRTNRRGETHWKVQYVVNGDSK